MRAACAFAIAGTLIAGAARADQWPAAPADLIFYAVGIAQQCGMSGAAELQATRERAAALLKGKVGSGDLLHAATDIERKGRQAATTGQDCWRAQGIVDRILDTAPQSPIMLIALVDAASRAGTVLGVAEACAVPTVRIEADRQLIIGVLGRPLRQATSRALLGEALAKQEDLMREAPQSSAACGNLRALGMVEMRYRLRAERLRQSSGPSR